MLKKKKKSITVPQVKKAFKNIYNAGIFPTSFYIVGWPSETKETLQDTIDLAKDTHALRIRMGNLYPYKGTEIRKEVDEKKLWVDEKYKDMQYGDHETPVVKNSANITKKLVDNVVDNIYCSAKFIKKLKQFTENEKDPILKKTYTKYQNELKTKKY